MDPPKIVHRHSDVNVKMLDNSVANKWKWEWLDYSFTLDLGGAQKVCSLINMMYNLPGLIGKVI